MANGSVKMLRPGDRLPDGEPFRRVDGSGYIRLIWRVDQLCYVEVYEHRVEDDPVVGKYVTHAHQVRHLNGDKSDNRPENLRRYYTRRRKRKTT